MEVPAQAVLGPCPLGDEILAVVDEETDLALDPVERRDREVLAHGCPGDGEGIDRVALAGLTRGTAGAGHELRMDPDDRLAGDEQVARQAATEVAAVLDRPAPLGEATGPADELEVAGGGGDHGLLGDLPAGPVGRHRGLAALVRIDPDDDHLLVAS